MSYPPSYTPELYAVAKRMNRTLLDTARALLVQSSLPRCLWPLTLKHIIYMRSTVQQCTVHDTPCFVLTNKRLSFENIRVFSCNAYALRLPFPLEFKSRAVDGIYLETMDGDVYKFCESQKIGINVFK